MDTPGMGIPGMNKTSQPNGIAGSAHYTEGFPNLFPDQQLHILHSILYQHAEGSWGYSAYS